MAKRHVGIRFGSSDKLYVYRIPDTMSNKLIPGQEVKIPGSIYSPSAKWVVVYSVMEDYCENKRIEYVEILDTKPAEKRRIRKDQDNDLYDLPATVANFKVKEMPAGTDWQDNKM